jgi:hypothetical protein
MPQTLVLGGVRFMARSSDGRDFLEPSLGKYALFFERPQSPFADMEVPVDYVARSFHLGARLGGGGNWCAPSSVRISRAEGGWLLETKANELEDGSPSWTSWVAQGAHSVELCVDMGRDDDGASAYPGLDRYPHLRHVAAWRLAESGGLWIHASVGIRNGIAYVFTGRSGRGKSTLSRLLHAAHAFEIACDEKNVLREHGDEFWAFGTPWTSSARLCANVAAPLGGLFFLGHAKENAIAPCSAGAALKILLPQIHLPWFDDTMCNQILGTVERLIERTPKWTLGFRPDEDVAQELADFVDAL